VAAGVVVWALVQSARSERGSLGRTAFPAGPSAFAPVPSWRGRFPNVLVQTHDGRTVRFYDDLLKGRRVTINFMYIECEGTCPGVTQSLVEVERALGTEAGRDVLLLSIALLPETDTSERLREYARRYGAGPGLLFLTGKPEDIDRLRHALGFAGGRDSAQSSDPKQHAGLLRIGNEPRDWWTACPSLASPAHILSVLRSLKSPERPEDAGRVKPPLEAPDGPPGPLSESLSPSDHRELEALLSALDLLHMARANSQLGQYVEKAIVLMAKFLRLEEGRSDALRAAMRKALDESILARRKLEAVRADGAPSAAALRSAWSRYRDDQSRALHLLDPVLDATPRHQAFRFLGPQWLFYLEGHPDHAETRESNR
jgi:protein SCO1/2